MQNKKKPIRHLVIANRRIFKMMLVMGTLVAIIVSNVLFTMFTGIHYRSGKEILTEKENSGLHKEQIIASRGYIYDRNKEIIAQDIESYNVVAILDEDRQATGGAISYVSDIDQTAQVLSQVLGHDANIYKEYLQNGKEQGLYQTEFGTYAKDITAQQRQDIIDSELTGIEFTKSLDRVYPVSHFASQMIGYAQYNEEDGKITGVSGMEQTFDDILSGTDGEITFQTDSKGNYIPNTKKYTSTAVNGNDIYLTIDKNVQTAVEKALGQTMETNTAEKAWCIVMEAATGKVLAQAGYPSFDLNERDVIDNHLNLPSEYLFEPGSVLKPFVYAAAMQEQVYPDENAKFQSGSVSIGVDANGNVYNATGQSAIATFNDALGKEYGIIGYDEGIIRSTNTAIIHLLLNYLSPDLMLQYMDAFELFAPIDIYGINTTNSTFNSTNIIDKFSLGFGQGSSLTAYQLIQGARALFTDGRLVQPYVVEKIVDPNTNEVVYQAESVTSEPIVDENTLTPLQDLLKRIVSEEYGTAHHYEMSDITLMAKTGTGEIFKDGQYSNDIYTTSIIAAAPAEQPEIIIYYGFQSNNIQYYNPEYFQDIVREGLLAVDSYTDNNTQTTVNNESAIYSVYEMPALVNHSFDYINNRLSGKANQVIFIGDGNSVIAQYPNEHTQTISTQKVFLLTDATSIIIPNMTGWSRKDVSVYCEMIGLEVSFEGSGYVSAQSIEANSLFQVDSKMSITLTP